MPNYKPIQYKLVCEQKRFCYLDFCSYNLRLIIQNHFHLLLKVLLHSKFNCKKHLLTPKTTAKNQGLWSLIWWKITFSQMLPGNKKCAVRSNYCKTSWQTPSDLHKYRWVLRVCSSLGSMHGPCCARYKIRNSLHLAWGINLILGSVGKPYRYGPEFQGWSITLIHPWDIWLKQYLLTCKKKNVERNQSELNT